MYIIELFFKLKKDFKMGKFSFKKKKQEEAKEELCSHLFVPIDSTEKILACSKCGKIHKVKKEKNPFDKK